MKRTAGLVFAAAMLVSCSAPGSSGARFTPSNAPLSTLHSSSMRITGAYLVPSFGCVGLGAMVKGPDKRVWFTEFESDAIGAITTAGNVSVFPTGSGSQPNGIAVRRKTIWSGGYGGTMLRSTIKGSLATFPIAGAHIGAVVEGPDKNMWFTDYGSDKIGRITKNGVVTEFALPTGLFPNGIAVGNDKSLWVTAGRKILKVSVSGAVIKSYGRNLTAGETINFIVAAPDGKLYFSEYANDNKTPDKIGRITTSGKIREIGSLPVGANPNRLTVGKNGNVYFAMGDLQAVCEIDLASSKVSYHWLPMTRANGAQGIAEGADKRLWVDGCSTIYAVSY